MSWDMFAASLLMTKLTSSVSTQYKATGSGRVLDSAGASSWVCMLMVILGVLGQGWILIRVLTLLFELLPLQVPLMLLFKVESIVGVAIEELRKVMVRVIKVQQPREVCQDQDARS